MFIQRHQDERKHDYSIIKGGIINFSRQLASYYGKFG